MSGFGSYVIDEATAQVAEARGTAIRGVGKFLGTLARAFASHRGQEQQEAPCPDATPDGGNDCVERSQDLLQKAKEKRLARLRAAQERG